ncbi:hypothetical protein C0431_03310 [bacterium]|jgi:hypothetical protein|nr:hypothetical protein [bacterium]
MQDFAFKKWWIPFVAGAFVVGCAGGVGNTASTSGGATTGTSGTTGTTGTTATTGTTGPTRSVPTVTLPSNRAEVRVSILSGQGRRIPGSLYAQLNGFRMRIGGTDIIPTDFIGSTDGINVQLDGYTTNKFSFSQDMGSSLGKSYQFLSFDMTKMFEEQLDGSLNQIFNGSFPLQNIPVEVPVVPGRESTVQVFLNNAALGFDFLFDRPTFDQNEFDFENALTGSNRIQGFLSDMISFNISSVATRPGMASGGSADKFMISGDAMGISRSAGFDGSFDLFSPNFIESGVTTNPVQLPDGVAPGTYNVLEPDPSVIPPAVVRITALQGTWRDVNSVITNMGTSGIVVFPTSRPGQPQMAVAYVRSGNTFTELYFGEVTIGATTGTVTLWPISQATVDAGSRTGGFSGTLSNLTITAGTTKDGDYTLTGAPGSLAASGVFVVYSR